MNRRTPPSIRRSAAHLRRSRRESHDAGGRRGDRPFARPGKHHRFRRSRASREPPARGTASGDRGSCGAPLSPTLATRIARCERVMWRPAARRSSVACVHALESTRSSRHARVDTIRPGAALRSLLRSRPAATELIDVDASRPVRCRTPPRHRAAEESLHGSDARDRARPRHWVAKCGFPSSVCPLETSARSSGAPPTTRTMRGWPGSDSAPRVDRSRAGSRELRVRSHGRRGRPRGHRRGCERSCQAWFEPREVPRNWTGLLEPRRFRGRAPTVAEIDPEPGVPGRGCGSTPDRLENGPPSPRR